MRGDVSSSTTTLAGIIESSRRAHPVLKTKTIVAKIIVGGMDGSGLLDLEVQFLSSEEVENPATDGNSVTCVVSIPRSWTPRMFLASVNKTIGEHNVLSLESVKTRNFDHYCINEIHLYYNYNSERVRKLLLQSAAYIDVNGGEMI